MIPDAVVKQIEIKYKHLNRFLNERTRRWWAATEASALGYGGILAIHRATGVSQNTIRAGLKELLAASTVLPSTDQIRKSGGGRKRVEEREPSIHEALDRLVEPSSRGEAECPLVGRAKSVNQLTTALQEQGYLVCAMTVYTLLREMGYRQAEQSSDSRRETTSRSRSAVSIHCPASRSLSSPASSSDLD